MKKQLMVLLVLLVFSVQVSFATFNDTKQVPWADEAINFMVEKSFISGYSDELFMPQQALTRAEAIHVINRMNGLSDKVEIEFLDVDVDHWAYVAVQQAVADGYINGFPDGTFRPEAPITRAQFAAMLARVYDLEESSVTLTLSDKDQVPEWARRYVAISMEHGLMKGYTDGTFRSDGLITRAEGTQALYNVVKSAVYETYIEAKTEVIVVVEASDSGGSAPVSQPDGTKDLVLESMNRVILDIDKYVLPLMTTDLQESTTKDIQSAMKNYVKDSSYDFDLDMERARNKAKTMTSDEYAKFRSVLESNLLLLDLQRLKQFFNL
ncbi:MULTISPECIES: S-layer homology domain-containing protein [unclassified Fusibacter]|uniref:S-layer homology domain-containing protein n=1 Tax=unclassified Fusibacter TaxID=2624464 RepID=UPI001013B9CF|nr:MULTISPECIES: S-layer homology domain-containing protein [unclassified Fusibacter]MCK8059902.1 S-layer homology domain-containing protein [Fusibacter sp. A2]NPE23891.1 S-layer homology domain-containing protein [Fusibacter sp. A1]RXV58483.1 S-layer homology domain-containing protein [Fusibacter sp. A1]